MADKYGLPDGTPPYYTERVAGFEPFIAEFKNESNRGCAVLVMCVLENSLRDMFKALLVDEGGKKWGNMAPRGGWSKMLENAYMLGLLSKRQCAAFDALVQVRNKFAHASETNLSFDSPEIVALLHASPPAIDLPPNMKPADDTHRTYFLMAAAILWMIMTFKLPTIQRLAPAGDPPTAGMPGYT